jgi:hypothetical protein
MAFSVEVNRYSQKLTLTLGKLVLYRLIANIPVPGFNAEVIKALKSSTTAAGDLISILKFYPAAPCRLSQLWQWAFIHTLPRRLSSTARPDYSGY